MSENIRRSHSHTGFERYFPYIFARKYYRCEDCDWRWSPFGLSLVEDRRIISYLDSRSFIDFDCIALLI